MAKVTIRNVVKRFGKTTVIPGLDLEIEHNEFVVLVGPSGCGKSTTLRMIAGLEEVTDGGIYIGDRLVNNVEPKNRNIAMVFQNYALYPHMTVARNIAFGLRAARLPKPQIEARVRNAAEILGLTELLERRPAELSGGQRQRVAMGRAIVREPDVFLFDEPLSNLDAKLRSSMRTEIKKLHQEVQTTVIYVTHDQVEAMTLADRIVIMRDGLIQQIGTPLDVFHRPANLFVATFIGSPAMNLIPGEVVTTDGEARLSLGNGASMPLPDRGDAQVAPGRKVTAGLRAEHLVADPQSAAALPADWQLDATVTVTEPLGSDALVMLDFLGHEVVGKAASSAMPEPGQRIRLGLDLRHLHLFDPATEAAVY